MDLPTSTTSLSKALPAEIISHIGSHLDQFCLVNCIRLSRLWNHALVPHLWRVITDYSSGWQRLLKHNLSLKVAEATELLLFEPHHEEIRKLFVKYGHHVRTLFLSSPALVAIISRAETCTQLQSINILSFRYRLGLPLGPSFQPSVNQHFNSLAAPRVSPLFQGHLFPNLKGNFTKEESFLLWNLVQYVWMMIRQNLRLRSLSLSYDISDIAVLSDELMNDIFSQLQDLEDLLFVSNSFDFGKCLSILPSLRSAQIYWDSFFNQDLQQTFTQLSHLVLVQPEVLCSTLFSLLKHLPGLISLKIRGINAYGWSATRVQDFMKDTTPAPLQELYFAHFHLPESHDSDVATLLIPLLTQLTTIVVAMKHQETVKALALHCKKLKIFRQAIDQVTTHPVNGLQLAPNLLCGILESCADLEELDAIDHKFELQKLLECRWASSKMKVFRVQIVQVERFTAEHANTLSNNLDLEGNVNDYLSNSTSNEPRHAHLVLSQSRNLQNEVCRRISQWTSLKTLCFGHEYRNLRLHELDEPPYYNVDGTLYLRYDNPIPDTLELSLKSGLDKLSTLKDLEVFGFEGLDHSIGTKELDWMAKYWPKLKIMRGLQEDRLVDIEEDKNKTKLRNYFQSLRPDVMHQTKNTSMGLGLRY
ncbi:hypothetical protein FBU30_007850 [Linnemannia zychae]|nr:hypothetical protein FBU30_007850 [Linnemannia zychae]